MPSIHPSPSSLEHEHTPDAIRRRLEEGPRTSYLRDWIYGGIDGAVTTFAIVAGSEGADLSAKVVVILGMANLLADGFSMAAGNYSGTRAERDERDHWRRVEQRHIAVDPAGEREEVRQIFRQKGLEGEALEQVVEAITSDRERWVDTMLSEEYGLASDLRSPMGAAWTTFSAFLICGAVPILPFLFGWTEAFTISIVATGCVFFAIGCGRSRWSVSPWWQAGLSTFALGSTAALLSWGVGRWLSAWLG